MSSRNRLKFRKAVEMLGKPSRARSEKEEETSSESAKCLFRLDLNVNGEVQLVPCFLGGLAVCFGVSERRLKVKRERNIFVDGNYGRGADGAVVCGGEKRKR